MTTYTQAEREALIAELSVAAGLLSVGQVRDWDDLSETLKAAAHMLAAPSTSPYAWGVQGSGRMWFGEYAEIDAKSEAVRCNGTSHTAFPLYKGGA